MSLFRFYESSGRLTSGPGDICFSCYALQNWTLFILTCCGFPSMELASTSFKRVLTTFWPQLYVVDYETHSSLTCYSSCLQMCCKNVFFFELPQCQLYITVFIINRCQMSMFLSSAQQWRHVMRMHNLVTKQRMQPRQMRIEVCTEQFWTNSYGRVESVD